MYGISFIPYAALFRASYNKRRNINMYVHSLFSSGPLSLHSDFLAFFFLFMVLEEVIILIWLFFTWKKTTFPVICYCAMYCKFLFPKVKKRRQINFSAQPSIRNCKWDLVIYYKQNNRREQDMWNKELCLIRMLCESLRIGSGTTEAIMSEHAHMAHVTLKTMWIILQLPWTWRI